MNRCKQLSTMSRHIATIRSLSDDVHDVSWTGTPASADSQDRIDGLLSLIKVECHILREHLKDMMPALTDEKIV